MRDQYIRRLLVIGMMFRMRQIIRSPERFAPRFVDILARKPGKMAAVAMANKTARMVWAVLTRN
jgi:transposase